MFLLKTNNTSSFSAVSETETWRVSTKGPPLQWSRRVSWRLVEGCVERLDECRPVCQYGCERLYSCLCLFTAHDGNYNLHCCALVCIYAVFTLSLSVLVIPVIPWSQCWWSWHTDISTYLICTEVVLERLYCVASYTSQIQTWLQTDLPYKLIAVL